MSQRVQDLPHLGAWPRESWPPCDSVTVSDTRAQGLLDRRLTHSELLLSLSSMVEAVGKAVQSEGSGVGSCSLEPSAGFSACLRCV